MPTWMTRRTSPARHQLRPSETVRGGCHGRTTQPAGQRPWTICFASRGAPEPPRHTRRRALPRPDGRQSLHLDLRTLGERLSGPDAEYTGTLTAPLYLAVGREAVAARAAFHAHERGHKLMRELVCTTVTSRRCVSGTPPPTPTE